MPTFTCITNVRDCIYLSQHAVDSPDHALRQGLGKLPYEDGNDRPDEEWNWLLAVIENRIPVELIPVNHCVNTWCWFGGRQFDTLYSTYIILTQMAADA